MADARLSPAKAVLLAVQSASQSDIRSLRRLAGRYPRVLRMDIVLRILLTHLPESLQALEYVPLIQEVVSGDIEDDSESLLDTSLTNTLDEDEASKQVRNLNLLQLAWPDAAQEFLDDPLVSFLVHRSLRIDQVTGLISQIPPLIVPFLGCSAHLRTWFISNVIPLTRFSYEYYPYNMEVYMIEDFEKLDYKEGFKFLLSRTGKHKDHSKRDESVGRDIRGLVGPWLYGDIKAKRRQLEQDSNLDALAVTNILDAKHTKKKKKGWEELFEWIATGASWETAVDAIEQWLGPSDLDLGGHEDQSTVLDEEEQLRLEQLYARAGLVRAYSMPADSIDAVLGVQRILTRLNVLLQIFDQVPNLQDASTTLSSIADIQHLLHSEFVHYIRNDLKSTENPFTTPDFQSMTFIQALCTSAYILHNAGCPLSVRQLGELILLQDEGEQKIILRNLMASIANGPKEDDAYWINRRRQVLWLRNWDLGERAIESGQGVFGSISSEGLEMELLKVLLANNRYALARSIYEGSVDAPLSQALLRSTIVSAALVAYDNASNASRSRGGVKRCDDILKTFVKTLENSPEREQLEYLVSVTDQIGQYRLVFKQGEPFTPVNLRVHKDPLSILGKMLDQNPRGYTKLTEFIRMGQDMVKADLVPWRQGSRATLTPQVRNNLCSVAEMRVLSMCIDAALAEDDFETAYSYVVSRLSKVASQVATSDKVFNQEADDYSWRAALQAGKYRLNPQTILPTHLGSDSSNLKVRHLEHRMQCLGHALRLAPKSTLQEILNVYRRCEEELETQLKSEEDQELAWDRKADREGRSMPGGFGSGADRDDSRVRAGLRTGEEAPVSLFDLSRASINRAQSGFSALAALRGKPRRDVVAFDDSSSQTRDESGGSGPRSLESPPEGAGGQERERVRKRDQLKDAAVGTLASGIGWLINAPSPHQSVED